MRWRTRMVAMNSLKSGPGIYISVLCLLLLGILFLDYRSIHPLVSPNSLLQVQSRFAFHREDPCFNYMHGEPDIPQTDSYVKVNITCPSGKQSANVLRFGAVGQNATVLDAIKLVSLINNFSVQDANGLRLGDGEAAKVNWRVFMSSVDVTSAINTQKLQPQDVIEIHHD